MDRTGRVGPESAASRMMELTFREYRNGDEAGILALYKETFDQMLDPWYWKWKYLQNPSGKVFLALAFDGLKCVGQYAMMPMSLCDHGRAMDTMVALDSMVHPDYQRRGILQKLEALIAADQPADIPYYTFLNENSFELYTRKLGWKFMGPLDVFMKPTNPASLAQHHWGWRFARPLLCAYQSFYRHTGNPLQAVPFDDFDPTIDQLWQRNKAKVGVTFNRSPEYLRWRFNQSPVVYHKYKLLTGDELVGFAVVRIQKKFGYKIGWVLDLFLDLERERALYRDAILAVEDQQGPQCDFISVLLPNAAYRRLITQAGFRKVPDKLLPHPFYFCVRQNQYPRPAILDVANWYLSWSLHDTL